MTFQEIHALVGNVPFISKGNARYLYDHIVENKIENVLELGIAHGTATCYIAAALKAKGGGQVTAVDLLSAKDVYTPSAEEQLESTGLSGFGAVHRMQTGYAWFLHDEIIRCTENDICRPKYDLCIIDGPKNWTIDGATFFMADKLLRKDGWIIFDDYNWTYASAANRRAATDGITHRELSKDELELPHIREIFELLVKQHPSYGRFTLLDGGDWAMAQKTESSEKTYEVVYREVDRSLIGKAIYKAFWKLRGPRKR